MSRIASALRIGSVLVALLTLSANALAWDSATHRLITRIAVEALPPSPLKTEFAAHERELEQHSVEPDSILKDRYGKREERRHYLDLETLGPGSIDSVTSDFRAMERRYGHRRLKRAGTLPWTIDSLSNAVAGHWMRADCSKLIRDAGYLSHYVGDASQPLHTTSHWDGYPADKGIHARVERAVDEYAESIGVLAPKQVNAGPIGSTWPAVISEIRDAHALVPRILADDRAVRGVSAKGDRAYDQALMDRDEALFAQQIARASSTLASIWLLDWRRAGSPARCNPRLALSTGTGEGRADKLKNL